MSGTIISGTMRPLDLIPCFLTHIRAYNPAKAEELSESMPHESLVSADGALDEDSAWWSSEECSEFLNYDLWAAMEELAPEGFHFGAHEGDGSDYGFWLNAEPLDIIGRIGDSCPEDHGGGVIYLHSDGYHVLAYTYGLSGLPEEFGLPVSVQGDQASRKLEVYRVQLDEPASVKLDYLKESDWQSIADCIDMPVSELLEHAKSYKPEVIASVLEEYASHWGWGELDHYPIKKTYREIEQAWK